MYCRYRVPCHTSGPVPLKPQLTVHDYARVLPTIHIIEPSTIAAGKSKSTLAAVQVLRLDVQHVDYESIHAWNCLVSSTSDINIEYLLNCKHMIDKYSRRL